MSIATTIRAWLRRLWRKATRPLSDEELAQHADDMTF